VNASTSARLAVARAERVFGPELPRGFFADHAYRAELLVPPLLGGEHDVGVLIAKPKSAITATSDLATVQVVIEGDVGAMSKLSIARTRLGAAESPDRQQSTGVRGSKAALELPIGVPYRLDLRDRSSLGVLASAVVVAPGSVVLRLPAVGVRIRARRDGKLLQHWVLDTSKDSPMVSEGSMSIPPDLLPLQVRVRDSHGASAVRTVTAAMLGSTLDLDLEDCSAVRLSLVTTGYAPLTWRIRDLESDLEFWLSVDETSSEGNCFLMLTPGRYELRAAPESYTSVVFYAPRAYRVVLGANGAALDLGKPDAGYARIGVLDDRGYFRAGRTTIRRLAMHPDAAARESVAALQSVTIEDWEFEGGAPTNLPHPLVAGRYAVECAVGSGQLVRGEMVIEAGKTTTLFLQMP
jgi:hypothetical protein